MIKYILLFFIYIQNVEAQTVRITDLVDGDGGIWGRGSGSINIEDDLCIYSTTGSYKVTASGSGSNSRFRVMNGSEFINYTVRWNDRTGTTGQKKLIKNKSVTKTTTETVSDNCNGGSNLTANLQIRFVESQLQKGIPGNYFGTLTIVIEGI